MFGCPSPPCPTLADLHDKRENLEHPVRSRMQRAGVYEPPDDEKTRIFSNLGGEFEWANRPSGADDEDEGHEDPFRGDPVGAMYGVLGGPTTRLGEGLDVAKNSDGLDALEPESKEVMPS
jgi:hypothetical protein